MVSGIAPRGPTRLALPAAASPATPGGGTARVIIGNAVHMTAKVVGVVDVAGRIHPGSAVGSLRA